MQIIENVTISRTEYDMLVKRAAKAQELEELNELRETLKGIRSGEIETIPIEVANKILDGENPIRVYRKYRGMTGQELANSIGTKQGYISELERGIKNGTPETLKKIATALNVSVDDLI